MPIEYSALKYRLRKNSQTQFLIDTKIPMQKLCPKIYTVFMDIIRHGSYKLFKRIGFAETKKARLKPKLLTCLAGMSKVIISVSYDLSNCLAITIR